MKLYIAGPMTGIPQFNYPAFDAAAKRLRDLGHDPLSPAEMDSPETRKLALASTDGIMGKTMATGETWGDFLSRDVKIVADECDGVVVLDDWHTSRGARLECFIAVNCNKPVYNVDLQELSPYSLTSTIMSNTQVDDSKYGE